MRANFPGLILIVVAVFQRGFASEHSATQAEETSCSKGHCFVENEGPCKDDGQHKLYRWDPVKVGYERKVRLEGEKIYTMITRAVQPALFEIPDFLSPEEADHIIDVAEYVGFAKSDIHLDPVAKQHGKTVRSTEGHSNSSAGYFLNWDFDRDYEITKDEVIIFAKKFKHLYLSPKEVDEMIEYLELKEFEDGKVEYPEWRTFKTHAIDMYMNDMKEKHPHHRDRFSDQVWLFQTAEADDVLRRLRERVYKLTRLQKGIVYGGEPLQVVKYGPHGHYHAHYDSSRKSDYPDGTKCCHYDLKNARLAKCRICRYITILYYLNDVEEGGETAFPVADMKNFNETEFRDRKDGDRFNLNEYCQTANIVVPAKKGKAIMWYNYELDGKTGWMNHRDDRSLHGGCIVKKGIKYIANNWLPAPENDSAHLISEYFRDPDEE
nr:transmembrane prolyl 4-hydroxylase-like [Pocillopora verrucosa]